ncbi:disintegrin and metalloproteinase domain-containing protein 10-like [Amblyomma americanum]
MTLKWDGLVVAFLLFIGLLLTEARRLNRFVSHFEPLSYQPHQVHRDHVRLRRSINQNQHAHGHVYLRFQGFNRLFHLKLRPDTSAFHKDLVVETAQLGRITPDISHIYSGELVGEPSSLVYGSLVDGVFHGAIQSPWGRYYVENARRFFPRPKAFHSVLYDARDAHFPDTGSPGGWCGLRADTERWMDAVMKSRATLAAEQGIRRKVRRRRDTIARWTGSGARGPRAFDDSDDYLPDSGERSGSGDEEALNASARIAVPSTSRRVCNLKLSIDHLLYGHMHDQESNPHRTRARITAFIAAHVTRASAVFQRTTFGNIQDITFIVQKIRINDSQSCAEGVKKNNPFCSDGIDASYLLHLTSKENNDDFCLAYTWTFRDFADGILGLAWIARPQLGQGGICEKNRPSVDLKPGTTEYRQYHLSLNTGIVTFLNYNNPVSQSVSEITFCHEMGHNFGSPHDAPPGVSCFGACAPCGSRGNYIMFPSATKGTEFNNDKFSPCSLRNITSVLKPMFEGRSNRENCFQVFAGPICGNDIVEGNEECDCGAYLADCEEKCCYPRHNTVGAPGCTLRKGEDCSPSAGPCCTTDCKLLDSSVLCKQDTMCRNLSYCDGINATCPLGPPKPDLTPCNEGTQVCMKGECSSSICMKYGLKECTLTGSRYSVDELCLIACQESGQCLPACDFPKMKAHCGAKLTPGAPCNGLRGYCDVFRKCRDVDAEGPLTRLQRIFFGERSVNKIKDFIMLHPLLSAFLALGTLWLMILAFRCLAVHTPTSNPNKKPAHKLKDTLKQPWRL